MIDEIYYTKKVNIIEMKNIIAVVAIITLIGAIYFNNNDINNLLGRKPIMSDDEARGLDISIATISIIIIIASIYVYYESYSLEREQGHDLTTSMLQLLAFTIAIIPTCILFYTVVTGFTIEKEYGTEPIV